MIPWVHLDTAKVPGGDELKLMRRGNEFSILAGSTTLMNSRMSGSEIVLAQLACDRLRGRRNCAMLIGGYGMGFTLRAALSALGRDAKVTVAELVPQVVEWARGPMAEFTAGCLDDPRVAVHGGDVGAVIAIVTRAVRRDPARRRQRSRRPQPRGERPALHTAWPASRAQRTAAERPAGGVVRGAEQGVPSPS